MAEAVLLFKIAKSMPKIVDCQKLGFCSTATIHDWKLFQNHPLD